MEKSRKPKIRFKGYNDDWEQRKVGDFLTESRIRGNTGLDAKKLTVKLWGKGVVEKNDFGGSEHTQYFTRRKGQFIYSKLDFLNSAFGVIPEKLDNYESTADLPAFDLDGMNPYFMYFVAIQESFYLKHGSIADGSRKAKRIHADTFLNMPVMVPTIDEQNLIVDFVQHLDNIITLHQRKLDKLVNVKKSMLEKMFPKQGSTVPEVRFSGFTEDWEQRKVGELLIERNQQAPMSEEYPLMAFVANEGVTPKGERYDRSALVTDTKNKLYKKTEFGDFIYSSNNLETGSIGLNKYGKACISPVYSIFKPIDIADSDFLGRRLVRKDFINTMVKWRQGVIYGQWRIHESDFLNIDILVPVTDEQQRIGKLLDDIDHLITLHQRKLEKLKNIKKSMLEKMFI